MRSRLKKHASMDDYMRRDDVDDWTLSYSDMMTLLFAFFALLLSFSHLDPVRLQLIAQSMNRAIGGAPVEQSTTLAEIQGDLDRIVSEGGLDSLVTVSRDRHGVALALRGSAFFASGSAELLSPARDFLSVIAGQISKVPYKIAIEGHTDNVPIATDKYPSNWELSASRAATVARYFIEFGLPPDRFRVVGYADTRPIDSKIGNATDEARSKNRRIVILFLEV